jgi:serine/threonine protein kinase/tetratricopeptide (TPR) repeat protein
MAACTVCAATLPDRAKFCFECGAPQAAAPPSDGLIGQTLGSYRILSVLGEGGMGKVYRAEQTSLGRAVCVKTLLPQLAGDVTLIERFKREARASSALNHPNIIGVLDFGESDAGFFYIVMELMTGGSLEDDINTRAPMPIARAVALTEQILSALEEAHGAGIVHRDLKPANVFLGKLRDGADLAKVGDFGLARYIDDAAAPKLTATGMVCGTPGYMSPEQISGHPLDGRSDVYAAGAILYEMLTGRAAFAGATLQDLFRNQLTGRPPSPSSASGLPIPLELDRVVQRSLEISRDARYASALELKRALEPFRVGASAPAIVSPTSAPGRAPSAEDIASAAAQTQPSVEAYAPTDSSAGDSFNSLRKLMPDKLVGQLEDLQHRLAGERRQVSVVFGDISGFTAMSERMDAEEVRTIMNQCFDGMVEAVMRYDGTVDKFIGDCIMVLFGAPTAHEDDPERAVRCSLEMLAYLEQVNRTLERPLGMRIGINTGEVVAGGVGGQRRMDYTVMGDVVNTAQRLESSAAVGSILVSDSVRRATEHAVDFTALEPIRVKGKTEPLSVFEVRGLRDRANLAIDVLLGRDDEMRAVDAALARALDGNTTGLLLLGDAGAGKSRLLTELDVGAQMMGFTVARARAGQLGVPVALDVIRQVILSLSGEDPDERDDDAPLEGLSRLGVEPSLIHRLQVLFAGAAASGGMDVEDQARTNRAALLGPLLQAGAGGGLCLLLDDFHLADDGSRSLIEELVARAPPGRIAVIATARPGETDDLLRTLDRVELTALPPDDVLTIARAQLSGAPLPADAADAVVERADGNPFVAQEVVRSMIDSGAMTLSSGSWSLVAFDAGAIPERVAQIVSARLDRLSADARALLRLAAIAGPSFDLDVVVAACDGSFDPRAAAAQCAHHGFLRATRTGYRFEQRLVRDTLLATLTRADRKALHTRVAEAIERGAATSADRPSVVMAQHFLAGEQWRKAARYSITAGDQLLGRGELAEAAAHFGTALDLSVREAQRMSSVGEPAAQRLFGVARKRIHCLSGVAPSEAVSVLESVSSLVPAHVGAEPRADALREHGAALLRVGRVDEACAALEEALRVAGPLGRPTLSARVRCDLGAAREARGDLAGATEQLKTGLTELAGRDENDAELTARFLNQLGRLHLRTGQPDAAREFFENARAHARRAGSAAIEGRVVTNLGSVAAMGGDVAGALAVWDEALTLARSAGDVVGVARLRYNRGHALAGAQRPDEASRELDAAIELATQLDWREGLSSALVAKAGLRPATSPGGTMQLPTPRGSGER